MSASKKKRVCVLFSGRGSNLRSLCLHATAYEVSAAICDNPAAQGLKVAADLNIEIALIPRRNFDTKKEHMAALLAALQSTEPDLICLAGFMQLLPAKFVQSYYGKILNIHPSLLPAYPGLDSHQRVLQAREATHGCSVHYVDAGMDSGPIVAQSVISVQALDSVDSLASRVLEREHIIYPWVMNQVALGEIALNGRTVLISSAARSDALAHGFLLPLDGGSFS